MKFAIVEFPGSNCDRDCLHAIQQIPEHSVRLVWHQTTTLAGYDAVILPGGFSYGDYLRAGAIARFSPVMAAVTRFANDGGPVLGICNGFQILAESGLLPGALMRNASMKFICKDTFLRVENSDTFVTNKLEKGDVVMAPVAHMEGRYVADEETLATLESDDRILFRYCDREGNVTQTANPNGSVNNIAGILSKGRNVAGMMPHPERAFEKALGGVDGIAIFRSIVSYLDTADTLPR